MDSQIEYARNNAGLKEANSAEMDPACKAPVIDLMESQKSIVKKGGIMRLGAWDCEVKPGTKVSEIYPTASVSERHRHRYEFNNAYLNDFHEKGMVTSGVNPATGLVEIVELKNHPFFVAGQFHPELKSTVANPHPLFVKFVAAAADHKYGQKIKKNK